MTTDWTAHVRSNAEKWNRESAEYQERHGEQIAGGMAWGLWQVPEQELQILGDVAGRDILEVGCGAAQWSIALAQHGARPVGLDASERQLEAARGAMAAAGVEFPLVHASAEVLPFADASFDVAFADHGAFGFTDPLRTIPEVARVLRPGGLFAFCLISPLCEVCWPGDDERPSEQLRIPLFGLHQVEHEGMVEFNLPYGEWIRLFRRAGLAIEDLVEIQPEPDATSTYRDEVDREWARKWPMEALWVCRREGSTG